MSFGLVPLAISLRNFQSFGNNLVTINLKTNTCTAIQGRNLDAVVDGQIDSNGAGKSTIRAGIVYACYGDTLHSKLKVGDLINRINKKNMQAIFDFEKDGKYYRIDRYKKLEKNGARYGGDGVYLLEKFTLEEKWDYRPKNEGGHDITPASTEIHKAIREKLGIPFEIFTRILTIAATATPFLSLEVGKQRELLEELFSYNELSERAESIKESIKDNKKELETLVKLDEQIKSEICRYNSQLTLTTTKVGEWNNSHQQRKEELKAKISEYNETVGGVDFDAEENNIQKIERLNVQITDLENTANMLERDLLSINGILTKIAQWENTHEKDLDDLCRRISQPLIFQSMDEVKEFQAALQTFTQTITTHNELISNIDGKIVKEKNIIAVSNKEISNKKSNIQRFERDIAQWIKENEKLADSTCPYCSQKYVEAKKKIIENDAAIADLRNAIASQTTLIEAENQAIQLSTDTISNLENEKQLVNVQKEKTRKEHEEFKLNKLGSSKVDPQNEYQKTADRQKLIHEFKLKENQTNPFLVDRSVEEFEQDKLRISEELTSVTTHINELKNDKKELSNSLVFKSIKEITSIKLLGETLNKNLSAIELEINPHTDSLVALQASPPSTRKTDKIDELHNYVEHQEFLVKLLTKKESFIRKALLNRYIPFLNERIKYYLDKLGLPYKVLFQEDMTVIVSQFKTEVNYASLSLGQQARVNIAFPFAFRDVLQKRFGVIPFCMLDEFLDTGLGNVGVQLAAKMVKEIAKENNLSIFIISHRDELGNLFDSKLTIELKNGFSTIVPT